MKEIWKNVSINGYIDVYQVSTLGRLRSLPRLIHYSTYSEKTDGQIVQSKLWGAYLQVCLCVNGKRKYIHVHRLVALTFIPNPLNKPQINHKDGNKLNNCVSNLEWVTASENHKHLYTVLGRKGINHNRFGKLSHTNKEIHQFTKEGELIQTYYSLKYAGEVTGIDSTSICKAAKGVINTAGGYIWKYADKVFNVRMRKGKSIVS